MNCARRSLRCSDLSKRFKDPRATTRRRGRGFWHHAGAGATHDAPRRRSFVAVADRAKFACVAAITGRHRGDRPSHRRYVDAGGARQQCRLKVEAPSKALVAGDRDELLRVVENLVENAIKYGASDPRCVDRQVEISLAAEVHQCFLSVRDHGPGIAPEHLPRLTERFYRVDAGQSRAKGGTGLGLAIVKHIVARHRGRLGIESQPGRGRDLQRYSALARELNRSILAAVISTSF